MDFCFSRGPIERLVATKFQGEWKHLRNALFSISEMRAGKAALELALFMRLLDDRDDISGYLKLADNWSFGHLIFDGKPDQALRMRDVANKIIHAATLEWDLTDDENPVLVCISQKKEKWLRAEIEIVALAAFCGGLMS